MSEHTNEHEHGHGHDEHHIVGIPMYLLVFALLIIGTILTYITAQWDLDGIFAGANTLLALLIASTKTLLVILIFMHVWWNSTLIKLIVVASIFCLAIMFAFTLQDYFTRSTGIF